MVGFKIRLLLTVGIVLSIVNADRTVLIDPTDRWQVFEGWGTSLCWWANVLGGFPDNVRNQAADLVFDLNKVLSYFAIYSFSILLKKYSRHDEKMFRSCTNHYNEILIC
ncbi:ricin-type beta-trefoil lectin domain protein [Gigaspora margarita]|uniref:Ricin-type beta-trefoil lectin domain protein n=1 Tax=Gigaspora margarita TaxID=4874 RepID=A0A8H3XFS0_GIGMA|nr:ricin-type beta-trefoil lectin domain protein [Gigaspora margarita]